MDDKELEIEKRWLQLVRVDSREFIRFYDKYVNSIYKYILVRTSNADVAMDLTNETFAIALDNLGGFRWRGFTFGAWLFRIALNLVRKQARWTSRAQPIDRVPDEALVAAGDGKLEELVKAEHRRFLAECLESLDEQSRNIFALHYWSNLTIREIAVVMDLKIGTIQSRLKRDREKIRRMYGTRVADFDI